MTEQSATQLIEQLSKDLKPYVEAESQAVIIGIETGGYWVAKALHDQLQPDSALGKLNISFYRDDYSKAGLHPTVKPSEISENLDDKTVILVDDVLYTGRTIRAAMNEIFDYGRPDKIILAVLIDRDGRELPIQADFSALKMTLEANQQVKIQGPEPITYRREIHEL